MNWAIFLDSRVLARMAWPVVALALSGCAAGRGSEAAASGAAAPVPSKGLAQDAAAGVFSAGSATLAGSTTGAAPAASASDSAPARQAGTAGDAPAQAAFDIRVDTPNAALRNLVQRHSELQRYRAVTDLDDTEFARLIALAERDVRNLLGTEGYFSPQVTLTREPAATPGGRPAVLITIEPGQATTIGRVDIGFEGDIAQSVDPATADGAQAQQQAIAQAWSLKEGARFTQSGWADAKTGALRQLVETRYPRGQVSYSLADVNAPAASAALTVRLDSGPLFRLGKAQVKGAERYPPELAERLSWLRPGDIYDQKRLVDAQQRLAGSGYYDSAYISIDPEGDPEATAVTYTVTEAKRHKVQLGLGYSTDSGPRVTLEHRDNTVFGSAWRLDSKLHLNLEDPLLQTELTSLPDSGGWRWGVLARYMRQDDGELDTTSQTLRAGRIQTTERFDRHFFLQYDHATVTGSGTRTTNATDALLGDGAAISGNFAWTGRYFDKLPTPSRGYGLTADIGVGMTTLGERKPFMRLTGRWLGIVPLGSGASRLALRTEAGAVLAEKRARLPSTYLFRTGGDASVRGYGYRNIGIDLGDNVIGPGRYMAAGSVEWQRPILQDRFAGLLEHTVFIDVGSVANRVNDMRAHWSVGTGVRLITPVGPMQLDMAYGLQSKDFRLHMRVGFVF